MTARHVAEEIVVKSEGDAERPDGDAVQRRAKTPRRTSNRAADTTAATARPKAKSKQAHKVDNSGVYHFGGSFGTAAMMIFFPLLMYYLWICSTFYGGRMEFKRSTETWLAFADRMLAHVTKVPSFARRC